MNEWNRLWMENVTHFLALKSGRQLLRKKNENSWDIEVGQLACFWYVNTTGNNPFRQRNSVTLENWISKLFMNFFSASEVY